MPEARLIDANALLKRLQEQQKYGSTIDSRGRAKAILEVIHAPTIEAEPVRHGRWVYADAIDYKDPNGVIHVHGMCSCCRLIYDFRDTTSRFKFCPDCGADMREGGADNG